MERNEPTVQSDLLCAIDEVCSGRHTLRDLLACTERVLRKIFKRAKVTILLTGRHPDHETKVPGHKRSAVRTFERDLADSVAGKKKLLIVNKNLAAFCKRQKIAPPGRTVRSFLAVPLLYQNEARGVIILQSAGGARMFNRTDASVISVVAPRLAMAVACDQLHEDNVRLTEEIKDLTLTDPQTGMPNRRFFDIMLDIEYRRARGYSRQLSLAMVGLDQFPGAARKQGKKTGDELLVHVAITLKRNFRDTDFVARCDRNTFAVILPEAKKEAAVSAAERVRKAVERAPLVTKGGGRRKATVSLGVVTYPGSAENLDTLLEQAGKALARAQQLSRNQVVSL
ncbi:sensor domain-containing diguanylate cyclase [candidate division WOR-3 bacterium]|nr:sensor domain-containing diguanylate cyclase [candidate division WOR-3 bacterium]